MLFAVWRCLGMVCRKVHACVWVAHACGGEEGIGTCRAGVLGGSAWSRYKTKVHGRVWAETCAVWCLHISRKVQAHMCCTKTAVGASSAQPMRQGDRPCSEPNASAQGSMATVAAGQGISSRAKSADVCTRYITSIDRSQVWSTHL